MDIVNRASVPSGRIEVMVPTCTPADTDVVAGVDAVALAKYRLDGGRPEERGRPIGRPSHQEADQKGADAQGRAASPGHQCGPGGMLLYGNGSLGSRAGVVGRLTGVGAPAESERVVEERLEDGAKVEVGQCVVAGPFATVSPNGDLVLRQPGKRLADVVPVALEHLVTELSFSNVGRELCLVVGDEAGQLLGQRRDVSLSS